MRIMLFGTFDLLHPGHLFVLHEAARRSDDVIVVVARDANVQRIKCIVPHESEAVRCAHIRKAFPSFTIVLGDDSNFLVPIVQYRPDVLLLGYDQRLPPGVEEVMLPPIERLYAFQPEKHKSSIRRKMAGELSTDDDRSQKRRSKKPKSLTESKKF